MSETKETRVGRYSDLRNQIDKMDTLSFDDPDRAKRYGLNGQAPIGGGKIVHEPSASEEELHDIHIKKNTLSISIDDLIKENDDYTMAMEKKEIDKKYKEVKKKHRQEGSHKKLIIWLSVAFSVIVIVVVVLICLHCGGII